MPATSILLDTDMLTDCDDAAALALAFQLERRGDCRLLGITVSSAYPASCAVVSAIADFSAFLDGVRVVIHCGACVWNRRAMLQRISECQSRGIPITNYGMAIAWCLGILERAIQPLL